MKAGLKTEIAKFMAVSKAPKKKPYFWIADAKMDAEREKRKRGRKRRGQILDLRSVIITLAAVGIVALFQNLRKDAREYLLSGITYAYKDFEETANRSIATAVAIRSDIGSIPADEKERYYNDYNAYGIDRAFLTNFLLALGTKNPERATEGLRQYDKSIYGKMSGLASINKGLTEKIERIVNIAQKMNDEDASAIASNTASIQSILQAHRAKLQEILDLQRKMLKIIQDGEARKREGELSTAEEKIREYYVDLDWQAQHIGEANDDIRMAFSDLRTE